MKPNDATPMICGTEFSENAAEAVTAVLAVRPGKPMVPVAVKFKVRGDDQEMRPAFLRPLFQFRQLLIDILLVATGIAVALGEWGDAAVILGVVIINAIVGCLQEAKAEKALDALAKRGVTGASVRRGGVKGCIPATHFVPGAVVLLPSADRVPACCTSAICRLSQPP